MTKLQSAQAGHGRSILDSFILFFTILWRIVPDIDNLRILNIEECNGYTLNMILFEGLLLRYTVCRVQCVLTVWLQLQITVPESSCVPAR